MHRHFLMERSDLLGKFSARLLAQPLGPELQLLAHCRVQPRDRGVINAAREQKGRQPRSMQNLVRVSVADTTEESRVGECALERVVLAAQPLGELRESRIEDLDASGIKITQRLLSLHEAQ